MALNPRIKSIEVGIEELKTHAIYPLSLAGEFKLSDIISKAAADVAKGSDTSDIFMMQTAIEAIKVNLGTILEMVTKKNDRPDLNDMDNVQFSELADLIFEMNFAGAIKNFQSLVAKMKGMFLSTGQSPSSSEQQVTE